MTIRHGETIGVAGRSGCGKTTWLRVLMRLTHPSSGGYAAFGGVPRWTRVTREAIGRMVGYVGQNPFVFSGTIAENIAYGSDGATMATRSARPPGWPASTTKSWLMPGGYDARVVERGQNLSGGQRQRLALARVFLKNPPVLVLDEATSALDTISERRVQQAIADARVDRTVILVGPPPLDPDRHRPHPRLRLRPRGRAAGPTTTSSRRDGVFADLVRHASGEGVAGGRFVGGAGVLRRGGDRRGGGCGSTV